MKRSAPLRAPVLMHALVIMICAVSLLYVGGTLLDSAGGLFRAFREQVRQHPVYRATESDEYDATTRLVTELARPTGGYDAVDVRLHYDAVATRNAEFNSQARVRGTENTIDASVQDPGLDDY